MRFQSFFLFVFFLSLVACNDCDKNKTCDKTKPHDKLNLSGFLKIFHAGSLSVPFKEITSEFNKLYPDINIEIEVAGSVECARKISELNKVCDIFASADYAVIDNILIPEFASWNIKFVSNEMAIVYNDKSSKNAEINSENWYNILLDSNVIYGRANPNTDPCGYRSELVMKLSELYYNEKGLAGKLLNKDKNNIRPKEVDLLALLETGNIDYIFLYRSVAIQHNLKYISLPDQINLKNPMFDEIYSQVSVEINGNTPDEKIMQKGEAMVYGVTIPNNSVNKKAAIEFLKFLLNEKQGIAILKKCGQNSVVPAFTNSFDSIPPELQIFAKRSY